MGERTLAYVERALAEITAETGRAGKAEPGSQLRRDLAAVEGHLRAAKTRLVTLARKAGAAAAIALAAGTGGRAEAAEAKLPYEINCLERAAMDLLLERDGYELVGSADGGDSMVHAQPDGERGWMLLYGQGLTTCIIGAGRGWEPRQEAAR